MTATVLTWHLTSATGGHPLGQIVVERDMRLSIGRQLGNDIVLDDAAVSRQHAELVLTPDGGRVLDKGSSNGTFLAGDKVGERVWTAGEPLQIGPFTLQLRLPASKAGTVVVGAAASADGGIPQTQIASRTDTGAQGGAGSNASGNASANATAGTAHGQTGAAGATPIAPSTRSAGPIDYLRRHFKGQLGLGWTFWINYFAFGLITLFGLTAWADATHDPGAAYPRYVTLLLAKPIIIILSSIGVWMAARQHAKAGRSLWMRILARMVVALAVLGGIVQSIQQAPVVAFIGDVVNDRDAVGQAGFSVSTNGNTAILDGAMSYGAYRELKRTLATTDGIEFVQMESPGGLCFVGIMLADMIKASQLSTYSTRQCDSACTVAFAAGEQRLLGPNGSLGYHRSAISDPRAQGLSMMSDCDQQFQARWRSYGLPEDFITRAHETPNDSIWRPSQKILTQAGAITGIEN